MPTAPQPGPQPGGSGFVGAAFSLAAIVVAIVVAVLRSTLFWLTAATIVLTIVIHDGVWQNAETPPAAQVMTEAPAAPVAPASPAKVKFVAPKGQQEKDVLAHIVAQTKLRTKPGLVAGSKPITDQQVHVTLPPQIRADGVYYDVKVDAKVLLRPPDGTGFSRHYDAQIIPGKKTQKWELFLHPL